MYSISIYNKKNTNTTPFVCFDIINCSWKCFLKVIYEINDEAR